MGDSRLDSGHDSSQASIVSRLASENMNCQPCTLEWGLLPVQDDSSAILACGTYSLPANSTEDEAGAKRNGYLVIYDYGIQTDSPGTDQRLRKIQQIKLPFGIFRLKWLNFDDNTKKRLLGVSATDGTVRLYAIHGDDYRPTEVSVASFSDSAMMTNIVFNPSTNQIAIPDSQGFIHLAQLANEGSNLAPLSSWKAHSLPYTKEPTEVWTAAWLGATESNLIGSGGDDSILKIWDQRQLDTPVLSVTKEHCAGVTELSVDPQNPDNFFISGSYDQFVRLWDIRKLVTPLTKFDVGGGVWKCAWRPQNNATFGILGIACMQAGYRILKLNSDTTTFEMMFEEKFTKQDTLCYGFDWSKSDLLASCSFYDKYLQLDRFCGLDNY